MAELDRIERAIYYAGLFFWAKRTRRSLIASSSQDAAIPINRDNIPIEWRPLGKIDEMFAREFSVLEMEQIRCVIEVLLRHESQAHNTYAMEDIEGGAVVNRLIQFPEDQLAGAQLCEDYLQALRHFLTGDRRKHNMWTIRSGDPRTMNTWGAAVDEIGNFPIDRSTVRSLRLSYRSGKNPSQGKIDSILNSRPAACRSDRDDGPARRWRLVNGKLGIASEKQQRFTLFIYRHRGYVFWDNKRVFRAMPKKTGSKEWSPMPGWIEATYRIFERPAYADLRAENRAFPASRAARAILKCCKHEGRFDFAAFMADGMADQPLMNSVRQAFRYHLPSADTCVTCFVSGRGQSEEHSIDEELRQTVLIEEGLVPGQMPLLAVIDMDGVQFL